MTTAPRGGTPVNSGDRERADLTAINGIGPARQRWLRESLGVRTFLDLAALSADEIESRLKAEGWIASRSDIEQWVARAQELAEAELPPQRLVESTHVEAGEKASSPAGEDEWKPFASFVVEFQARQVEGRPEEQRTTVGYMEADTSETWPGIEGERLCQWMLDQMGEKLPRQPEEAANVILIKDVHGKVVRLISIGETRTTVSGPFRISPEEYRAILEAPEVVKSSLVVTVPESETEEEAAPAPEAALPEASIVIEEPAAAPSVAVEITQAQAFQPPQAETPIAIGRAGQPFSGFVRSGEPFALRASLELVGPAAAELAKKPATCSAQFLAHNLSTGARIHLGDTEPDTLVEGALSYTAVLPEVTLRPGMYRLRVLATLHGVRTAPGYLEVPVLRVI